MDTNKHGYEEIASPSQDGMIFTSLLFEEISRGVGWESLMVND